MIRRKIHGRGLTGQPAEKARSRSMSKRAIGVTLLLGLACGRVTNSQPPKGSEEAGAMGESGAPAQEAGSTGESGRPTHDAGSTGESGGRIEDAGASGAGAPDNPQCPAKAPADGTACPLRGRVCAIWGACAASCTCGPQGWKCATPDCQPGCNYDDPNRKYVAKGSCESIDFSCANGQTPFQDRCGCGCLLGDGGR